MKQVVVVLSLVAAGAVDPNPKPAGDDCMCTGPQSMGYGCGHGPSVTKNVSYCGQWDQGGCTDPMTCPFCKDYALQGQDFVTTVSCGVKCKSLTKQTSDLWCTTNCNGNPPKCPPDQCSCDDKLLVSATDCGSGSHVKLTSFETQIDPVLGQMVSVKLFGLSTEAVTDGATFEINVTSYPANLASDLTLPSVSGKVCEDSNFDLQVTHTQSDKETLEPALHLASFGYHGLTCPTSKGNITMGVDITLPLERFLEIAPGPTFGAVAKALLFTVQAKDESKGDLFCAGINVTTVNAMPFGSDLNSAIIV